MHGGVPSEASPQKRQRLVLNLQLRGNLTMAAKMEVEMTPGMPVHLGMSMTVVEEDQGEAPQREMGGSPSQGFTERISPLTPELLSGAEVDSRGPRGQSHIVESELTSFMTGDEGQSVFRAWALGGFTSEQILRLYGQHVMEAFVANQMVLEAGQDSSC